MASEDWESNRDLPAFPKRPSRLKLGVRWPLGMAGELLDPLRPVVRALGGISMVKLSRAGRGNCLEEPPVAESGESPVDDGDIST